MKDLSYIRACTSCLPVIGPFVAMYNALETKEETEQASDPVFHLLDQIALHRFTGEIMLAMLSEDADKAKGIAQRTGQEVEIKKKEIQNRHLPLSEKGRTYSICGIIGNVATVATLISLVSLNILTGEKARLAGFSFLFVAVAQTAAHSYNFYQHHQIVTIWQKQNTPEKESKFGQDNPPIG